MRFLLVDRITDLERDSRATGLKNVTLSEDFFTQHFPGHPIMPGALITECLVQLADWLLRESGDFNCISFPSRIELVKFHKLVHPGDQLQLDVQITGRENGLFQIRGEARCRNEIVAAARLEMRTQPVADFQAPGGGMISLPLGKGMAPTLLGMPAEVPESLLQERPA